MMLWPFFAIFWPSFVVCLWIAVAISFNFFGPWNIAYIPDIIANNTWAVQMLDVAFSRLICCSLVCKVSLYAWLPCLSFDTPTILPGISRLNSSDVAINAACGPPNPSGTPKRWLLPTAISPPKEPGDSKSCKHIKSVAKTTLHPEWCALSTIDWYDSGLSISPKRFGYCIIQPNALSKFISL